jgi:hypothetical protein
VFIKMRGASPMTAPDKHANRQKVRTSVRPTPSPDAYAFTIRDAQKMGAPGRTKIYDLKKRGELKLLRVAGRTMVDGDSLRALLRGAISEETCAEEGNDRDLIQELQMAPPRRGRRDFVQLSLDDPTSQPGPMTRQQGSSRCR